MGAGEGAEAPDDASAGGQPAAGGPHRQAPSEAPGVSFIWFDLGLTLACNQRIPTYRQVLAELGVEMDPQRLEHAFHLTDKLFMREYPGVLGRGPRTYSPWYLGVLHHRLGLELDLCRVFTRWREIQESTERYWRAFEWSHPVLERLRGRGYRLGVITNWDPSARSILAREGLAPLLEKIVVSSEVGVQKPDGRIFHLALEGTGVRGEECLYVGDNFYDDALGSRKVGMRPVILNPFGRLGVEEIGGVPILPDISRLEEHLERLRSPASAR